MSDYRKSKLFRPIKIRNLQLKNRFVVPPMETNLGGLGGEVTPELIGYWTARAKGGFGLLILENSSIDPVGNVCMHTPGFYDDRHIEGLRELTDAVHQHGAKMAAQISHSGRQTFTDIMGGQPVSASPVSCPGDRCTPHELTIEEIHDLIEKFGDAAGRVRKAGFDAVEIHGAHGYLIAQFMSPYANKRADEFGGSLDNRMRFPLLIIENVRKKVGGDYPVMFRISGDERVPSGRTITETVLIAQMLEKAGVDVIDVSTAVKGSHQYISAPPAVPAGFLLRDAAMVKRAVKTPVIAVGRLNEPALADFALRNGMADMIAIGRGSLADPDFPTKIYEGRLDDIIPCIACLQGCYKAFPKPGSDAHAKYTTTCLVNPFCCAETTMTIEPAQTPGSIVVAGGGPAGLEAAWVAAARGHKVKLFEKSNKLGGQFMLASIPPYKHEIAKALFYFKRMCDRYGVDITLGTEATCDAILELKPDAVVIATGGAPIVPKLEGVDGPNVVTSSEILAGTAIPGENVLIVGGGMVGCEVADFLGEHMHKVTLVEMLDVIAGDVPMQVSPFLMARLKEYGVTIMTGTKVVRFTDDGAVAQHNGVEVVLSGFDTIILAMGARPVNTLQAGLEGKGPELYVIGDAKEARQALHAIEEGAKTGLEV